jgi:hypothetical protein
VFNSPDKTAATVVLCGMSETLGLFQASVTPISRVGAAMAEMCARMLPNVPNDRNKTQVAT